MVPAAPLDPATEPMRLAAGHDRVDAEVVDVVDDPPLVVPPFVEVPELPDDGELHPARVSAPARAPAPARANSRAPFRS
jgi:hypothetical protein